MIFYFFLFLLQFFLIDGESLYDDDGQHKLLLQDKSELKNKSYTPKLNIAIILMGTYGIGIFARNAYNRYKNVWDDQERGVHNPIHKYLIAPIQLIGQTIYYEILNGINAFNDNPPYRISHNDFADPEVEDEGEVAERRVSIKKDFFNVFFNIAFFPIMSATTLLLIKKMKYSKFNIEDNLKNIFEKRIENKKNEINNLINLSMLNKEDGLKKLYANFKKKYPRESEKYEKYDNDLDLEKRNGKALLLFLNDIRELKKDIFDNQTKYPFGFGKYILNKEVFNYKKNQINNDDSINKFKLINFLEEEGIIKTIFKINNKDNKKIEYIEMEKKIIKNNEDKLLYHLKNPKSILGDGEYIKNAAKYININPKNKKIIIKEYLKAFTEEKLNENKKDQYSRLII